MAGAPQTAEGDARHQRDAPVATRGAPYRRGMARLPRWRLGAALRTLPRLLRAGGHGGDVWYSYRVEPMAADQRGRGHPLTARGCAAGGGYGAVAPPTRAGGAVG